MAQLAPLAFWFVEARAPGEQKDRGRKIADPAGLERRMYVCLLELYYDDWEVLLNVISHLTYCN